MKNKKKLFPIIIICILIAIAINSVFVVRGIISYNQGTSTYKDIKKVAVKKVEAEDKIDFGELKKINPDVVGWISLADTVIDYPVVKGKDNDYYLSHLFDGVHNTVGSIFVDFRNNDLFIDKVTVIYGHAMLNGSMFKILEQYKRQSFYDEHKEFLFQMEDGNYVFYPIAGEIMDATVPFVEFDFDSDEEFYDYINAFIARSTFKSEHDFSANDKVVMMISCSHDFEDARYVLISKIEEAD